MRILAQKINTIQDIEKIQENDEILIINDSFHDKNMWFGNVNHDKTKLFHVIFTSYNYDYGILKGIGTEKYVYASLYALYNNMKVYKILNETSINLIKMAKTNKSMFKLLNEIKII